MVWAGVSHIYLHKLLIRRVMGVVQGELSIVSIIRLGQWSVQR